ncbi:flavodoxin family protein [Clostridiaceae bacterium 35-E11]
MKALVILGSPRVKMNTDTLLDEVIRGMEQNKVSVEKIELGKRNIHPCIACGACEKTGTCFIKDDMKEMYQKFNEADIIIIGSPLYFNSVSAITKTMIDRCQAFWSSKYVLNKSSIDKTKKRRGLFVCVAGAKQSENGFIGATIVMELFFKAINAKYEENILIDNTDKTFVKNRREILAKAFEAGKKISSTL